MGVTDIDVLRAGVLHDVVEDTPCTLEDVRAAFGDRVAELVSWVTKAPPTPTKSPAEARSEYLAQLDFAPRDARLVKLADRLSNVQRLHTHPRPAKRLSYYDETVRVFIPLAGMHPWFAQWYADWQATYAPQMASSDTS